MKVEVGKAYRCPIGLGGIPTKDNEVVVVKSIKLEWDGFYVELEGNRDLPVMLSLFRKPFFERI